MRHQHQPHGRPRVVEAGTTSLASRRRPAFDAHADAVSPRLQSIVDNHPGDQHRIQANYFLELRRMLAHEAYWADSQYRGRIHEHLDRVKVWLDPKEDLSKPLWSFQDHLDV